MRVLGVVVAMSAASMVMVAAGCAGDEPTSLLLSKKELATGPTLHVGDPAPALVVKEWMRWGPIDRFEAGKVYVIDFWAAWCGPCLAIMPELAGLQGKYKAAGVVVVAMTAIDGMNTQQEVNMAMLGVGKGNPVSFAIDGGGSGNATVQAYMHATRETGIPRTFVVDQQGRLAWIGHPKDVEPVVAAIVAGTWDIGAAAAANEKAGRERTESRALISEWADAKERGADELPALEKLTAMDPENIMHSPPFWMHMREMELFAARGDAAKAEEAVRDAMGHESIAEEPWAAALFAVAVRPVLPERGRALATEADRMLEERRTAAPTSNAWEHYMREASTSWDSMAYHSLATYWEAEGDFGRAARMMEQCVERVDPHYKEYHAGLVAELERMRKAAAQVVR